MQFSGDDDDDVTSDDVTSPMMASIENDRRLPVPRRCVAMALWPLINKA